MEKRRLRPLRARLREFGERALEDPWADDILRLRLTEDELQRFRGSLAARSAALRKTVELLEGAAPLRLGWRLGRRDLARLYVNERRVGS